MNKNQTMLLGLALAATLSACSQANDDKEARSEANLQRVTSPGMNIESKGDASTVVTSDESEISITGNKSVQNRACTGQEVQVQGDDNQANFTGTCKGLTVIGSRNKITLENVATIEVTGTNNTVSWRGTKPQITNIGRDNMIEEAK